MKVLTYTVSVGTTRCNQRCPYCIAHLTPPHPRAALHRANLIKGADLAVRGGATTLLITGKGEPTLAPDEITEVLELLQGKFPCVELQTNGLNLEAAPLARWIELGLNTVAISGTHHRPDRAVPHTTRPDLDTLVEHLHSLRLTVRLSFVMVAGVLDTLQDVQDLVSWARDHKVEQLTLRPVTGLSEPHSTSPTARWIKEHSLTNLESLSEAIRAKTTPILDLGHGAEVLDWDGQNLCLTNCLTPPERDEIRQLIYCSDGHVRFDWRYQSSILI